MTMVPIPVAEQRRAILLGMGLGGVVALVLWLALARHGPAPVVADLPARLTFALRWICVAALLCVMAGVEAIAHERLVTPASNPLAGYETSRLRVNFRYLQNTLEQFLLFAPGLLGLASYADRPGDLRTVTATAVVWIASRLVFWIGYHVAPQHRAAGLTGMVQNLLVLLYVGARFGYDLGGWIGGAIVPAIFGAIEGVIIYVVRPRRRGGAAG